MKTAREVAHEILRSVGLRCQRDLYGPKYVERVECDRVAAIVESDRATRETPREWPPEMRAKAERIAALPPATEPSAADVAWVVGAGLDEGEGKTRVATRLEQPAPCCTGLSPECQRAGRCLGDAAHPTEPRKERP